MTSQENLVEILDELGPPPEGVSLETFAIAEVKPQQLQSAIRGVTPTYEGLRKIKEEKPELYEYIAETPQPDSALGEGILLKQQKLSKPRRVLASALVALTMASGMGAANYVAKEEYREDMPGVVSKENQLWTTGAAAGLGGIAGAMTTYIGGFFFTHRLARRPAKKIVKRAQQESV